MAEAHEGGRRGGGQGASAVLCSGCFYFPARHETGLLPKGAVGQQAEERGEWKRGSGGWKPGRLSI